MNHFDKDPRNPVFAREPKRIEGEGITKAEIFFGEGDRSEFRDIDYLFVITPDGIEVMAMKPEISEHSRPDDVKADVLCAIEEDLKHLHLRILELNWAN